MKDAWPVEAKASGGRHYRGDNVDQNFDTYSVEYTFADGTQAVPRRPQHGRLPAGVRQLRPRHARARRSSPPPATRPARCRIYKGQNIRRRTDLTWAFGPNEPNPYQLEWDHLIDAIRRTSLQRSRARRGGQPGHGDGPHGRHTGQVITCDEMLNCEHEFAPDVDKLTLDSAAPLLPAPTASTRSRSRASRRTASIETRGCSVEILGELAGSWCRRLACTLGNMQASRLHHGTSTLFNGATRSLKFRARTRQQVRRSALAGASCSLY